MLRFQVRPAFAASFSCERVNASAPCVPVLPISLRFTAPVRRELAQAIRLGGAAQREPVLGEEASLFVDSIEFAPPFPESATFQIRLPSAFLDDAGRSLENAASFPLEVQTDAAPPLARFNGEFGILELGEGGVLPVTLRDLEDALPASKMGGAAKRIDDEAGVLRWMAHVRKQMNGEWQEDQFRQPGRESVFAEADDAEAFELPAREGGKTFEVVGIPLKEPGFHVVELASPRLGAALLGENRPRYVATTALVTNLAVHFKWGREGSLAFVTTLDGGRPVEGAQLRVVDGCDGTPVWKGITGKDGIARIETGLPAPRGWTYCSSPEDHPLMVSARKDGDFSFTLSSWNQGIGPSDFQFSSGTWEAPQIAHTVLDRALFRAGETVSMKHFWRQHTATGLAVPAARPDKLVIEHSGSGQIVELPVAFDAQGIAESTWTLPKEARLGDYALRLTDGKDIQAGSGQFRVEQYRIPLMRAVVQAPEQPAVAATELPLDLFVGYYSGGGASGLPVKLRTQVQPRAVSFPQYERFQFGGAAVKEGLVEGGEGGYFPDENPAPAQPSPARTLPLSLDANGAAHVVVPEIPASEQAQSLFAELEYPDANGELTSARTLASIWPSALATGIATDGWVGSSDGLRFQVVVLNLKGQPVRRQPVRVKLYAQKTHSYRKRLVGGFYAYSHSEETVKLRPSCSGSTDEQGLLMCELAPGVSGQVLMEATTSDSKGRISRAVASTWLAGKDDWWFAQGDSDRMDVIAEQREIEPGQTLRVQVRMPFRKATGLVTVEREGVMDAFVVELSGRKPVIEIPIADRYAPNVYVSVLALRPRVSDFRTRFYDFLRRLGLDRWLKLDGGSPTAMVDLSKPAFRLGATAVDVGWTAHRLAVVVKPQQESYKTRGTASVQVQVTPAAGGAMPKDAEIAFSAVDEALLDLLANPSVNLLDQMMQRRGIEVFTSTAQMQVVGKRHYGRKSLPPGGGGGRGAARELLDSLLLWKGRVPLDAQGRATVEVPLNDALSSFRLTAVASAGADRFGAGHASIRTTQDVQLLSGLAPLVRENDRYEAIFTVRNTTDKAQDVEMEAEVVADGNQQPLLHATQKIQLPANTALPARFEFTAPVDVSRLSWTVRADGKGGESLDALKVTQDVVTATPVRVYQATLTQIDHHFELPVERPADAIAGRGGVRVNLAASLTASLDPVREWMSAYPYSCFEQLASKTIVLDDRLGWDALMTRLPGYLDRDGLVKYFPSNGLEGSDTLTAYLLAIAHEAGWEIPESEREKMLRGLANFVQGRVQRGSPLRLADQTERKLAALDALSRHGRAEAAWLSTLSIDPNLWHTSAVIDWIGILARIGKDVPDRARRTAEAQQILRSRLNFQGTTMGFSAEQDDALWWLMISADVNANRAILAVLDQAAWREDLPRMMRGSVGRQLRGHWNLTTANAWGALALRKFAGLFERDPVYGKTRAELGEARQEHVWNAQAPTPLDLPWPESADVLKLDHWGSGKPWAIVQSRAAIPLREPFSSGFSITRSVTPVEQKTKDHWTRGDVARVRVEIDAQSDMTWVVVDDPVPGGATLLGGGLGRDSQLLAQGERKDGEAWPAFEERRFDAYRAYYAFVPKGKFSIEYTVRYNTAGQFGLPATRVEAMYSPEMLGEIPNASVTVEAP
ncbi:MAG: alpha-2-macroglobulin family protein [Panacagrimonas sp.]